MSINTAEGSHQPITLSHENTQLNPDLQAALTKLRSDIQSSIDTCFATVIQRITQQEETITQLKSTIDNQNNRLTQLEQIVKERNTTSNVWQIPKTAPTIDLRAIINDEKEREKKKQNLIIFGLPESGTDDMTQCNDLLSKFNLSAMPVITNCKRLGKQEGMNRLGTAANGRPKPRPIVITLDKIATKFNILKQANHLRSIPETDPMSTVIIKADLTKMQLIEHKKLVSDYKRRKDDGEHVKISKGVIIDTDTGLPVK